MPPNIAAADTTAEQKNLDLDLPSALSAYRLMLTIRRFEEKLGQLVALGVLDETEAMATGNEAIAAGISAAAKPGDPLVCSVGLHAAFLARDVPADVIFETIIAGSGLRGTTVEHDLKVAATSAEALTIASGLAGKEHVAFCWIAEDQDGKDAAIERLRAAREAKAPVVCILQCAPPGQPDANGTVDDTACDSERIGVAVERIDAIEVGMVVAACKRAADRARTSSEPVLIAVRVPGFMGHFGAAAARAAGTTPRSREETCPIAKTRAAMLADGQIDIEDLKILERDVRNAISAAATSARSASPTLTGAV